MKLSLALLSGLILFTTNAIASSPSAWANQNKDVIASCIKASGLKEVKPAGAVANFTDDVSYSAIILQGRYPQKHMKKKKAVNFVYLTKKHNKPM